MAELAVREKKTAKRAEQTGIPPGLQKRLETASGLSLSGVRIHYNSDKPARVGALAYATGDHVYMGRGQERYLPHELGHVIQQRMGVVRPTAYSHGLAVNDSPQLERQADEIGAGVVQRMATPAGDGGTADVIQMTTIRLKGGAGVDEEGNATVGVDVTGVSESGRNYLPFGEVKAIKEFFRSEVHSMLFYRRSDVGLEGMGNVWPHQKDEYAAAEQTGATPQIRLQYQCAEPGAFSAALDRYSGNLDSDIRVGKTDADAKAGCEKRIEALTAEAEQTALYLRLLEQLPHERGDLTLEGKGLKAVMEALDACLARILEAEAESEEEQQAGRRIMEALVRGELELDTGLEPESDLGQGPESDLGQGPETDSDKMTQEERRARNKAKQKKLKKEKEEKRQEKSKAKAMESAKPRRKPKPEQESEAESGSGGPNPDRILFRIVRLNKECQEKLDAKEERIAVERGTISALDEKTTTERYQDNLVERSALSRGTPLPSSARIMGFIGRLSFDPAVNPDRMGENDTEPTCPVCQQWVNKDNLTIKDNVLHALSTGAQVPNQAAPRGRRRKRARH